MTDPVSIHLKDLDRGQGWVRQEVVHTDLGAEGRPVGVEGLGAAGSDVATANGCLRRAEITEERSAEGGWHICHEPGNWGEYLEWKRERREEGEENKREQSSAMVFNSPGW